MHSARATWNPLPRQSGQHEETTMPVNSAPRRLLALLGIFTSLLAHDSTLYAQPGPDSVNLAVFTSPIDVTGLPLVMRVSVPDRETGRVIDIPIPPGFI